MTSIFDFQTDGYNELHDTFQDWLTPAWRSYSVQPRWHTLIVGSSGSGKSFLAEKLSADCKVPLLKLSTSSWILAGAGEKKIPASWQHVAQTILGWNGVGILFLDEIDKVASETCSWTTYLRTELYGLLDGTVPSGLLINDDHRDERLLQRRDRTLLQMKLKNDVFVVSAGAFQSIWDRVSGAEIGFRPTEFSAPSVDQQTLSQLLQRELVNRFGTIIQLPFPTDNDYASMLESVAQSVPELSAKIRLVGTEMIPEAVKNKIGARFAERVIAKAIRLSRSKTAPSLSR